MWKLEIWGWKPNYYPCRELWEEGSGLVVLIILMTEISPWKQSNENNKLKNLWMPTAKLDDKLSLWTPRYKWVKTTHSQLQELQEISTCLRKLKGIIMIWEQGNPRLTIYNTWEVCQVNMKTVDETRGVSQFLIWELMREGHCKVWRTGAVSTLYTLKKSRQDFF